MGCFNFASFLQYSGKILHEPLVRVRLSTIKFVGDILWVRRRRPTSGYQTTHRKTRPNRAQTISLLQLESRRKYIVVIVGKLLGSDRIRKEMVG